jgi:DNA-directed RNA polymerase subunit RPC12/RpoP
MSDLKQRPELEDMSDEELTDEERAEKRKRLEELKQEKELLKMEIDIEKSRKELEEIKGVTPPNPVSQHTALGALLSTLIKSGVSPDQANQFLTNMTPEALNTLMTLTASSGNPYLPMFMFMAAQSRGGAQQVTVKDVVEMNKSLVDIAKDISQSQKGSDTSDVFSTIFNKFLEILLEDRQRAMQPQPGFWDQVMENTDKFQQLARLVNPGQMTPELQVKLEEMRQAHEREMKRFDLELLKLRSEMVEKRRRAKLISEGLKRLSGYASEGMAQVAESLTSRTSSSPASSKEVTVNCPSCNAKITAKVGEPFECPNCHEKLMLKAE